MLGGPGQVGLTVTRHVSDSSCIPFKHWKITQFNLFSLLNGIVQLSRKNVHIEYTLYKFMYTITYMYTFYILFSCLFTVVAFLK